MKTRVPSFAVRLLTELMPRQNSEAFIGDLAESVTNGRSTIWFWTQIITAILVALRTTLRSHPMLALRAITSGLVLSFIFELVCMIGWGGLVINVGNSSVHWRFVYQPHYFLECYVTCFFTGVFATLIVAAFHRKQHAVMVLIWTVFSFFWGCGWMFYFFLDPVRRYAIVELKGFLIFECGSLAGVLLSLMPLAGYRKRTSLCPP
jgi:hypothetical protein